MQEKDRELGELDSDRAEEIAKLAQDCADLNQQNNQLNFLLTKYKQELADKDALIGRSRSDTDA
ncbi:MAG: hypothetical protein KDD45_15995 [Bdellovibrionales bacterium]|nr:hypothetical protein [Bdellovibrionales bacterium]